MSNQKNHGNQLNQLKFSLSESQKKELIIKYERVRKILLDKKIVKNEAQLNNYSTYKKLNDYEKYCLIGNNYWVIMNGDYHSYVPVPPQDLHFWYYFNETCFIDCDSFQIRKKNDREEKLFRIENNNEFKLPDNESEKELTIEPEKSVEIKKETEIIDSEKKEDEMPMEENKDFLKQKQEHPKYDKEEIKKRMDDIKSENAEKKEIEVKKKEEDKKAKKSNKKKNDEQGSLF